ncbi:hypothetical protein DFJ63DRAFT_335128 [Scheffersomyces coipomensis]|uniref:uncharacterized protein n=1 Tax=Scheffersomyces coipomensis TaxID=1788519 RepID=UPI00315DE404
MISIRRVQPISFLSRSTLLVRPSATSIFKYSTTAVPPRKSYKANTTGLKLFWNSTIPVNVKYFGVIGISAYSFIHVHPDILITVLPPLFIGSYLGYKYYYKKVAQTEINKVLRTYNKEGERLTNGDKIQVKKYDESDVWNVLHGIENEFDHFKIQLIDVIEQRILNYIIKSKDEGHDQYMIRKLFIDQENDDQFSINIHENEVETWIMTKISIDPNADPYDDKIEFIKFSLPFYSSKDKTIRQRLGTIETYLLEVPTDEVNEFKEYKIGIEITPYGFLSTKETIFISSIDNEGITKSKILSQGQKTTEDEEEITL